MKKRVKNDLRYSCLLQKRIQRELDSGSIFEDYENIEFSFCSKDALKSFEINMLDAIRISADFRCSFRWRDDLSEGDRILFLDDFVTKLSGADLLKVQSYKDKTGRKERLDVICASGAFAGPAPVNPANAVVVKSFYTTAESLEAEFSDNKEDVCFFYEKKSVDALIRGGFKNKWILRNNGAESIHPVLYTFSEFTSILLVHSDGRTSQCIRQPYSTDSIHVYTDETTSLAPNEENLIEVVLM